jgi:hypothetical protein
VRLFLADFFERFRMIVKIFRLMLVCYALLLRAAAVDIDIILDCDRNLFCYGVNLTMRRESNVGSFYKENEEKIEIMDREEVQAIKKLTIGCDSNNTHITSLPIFKSDTFTGLLNYSVKNCPLKTVSSEQFTALSSIKSLNLSKNFLEFIPSNAFDSLVRLSTLSLARNHLTYLDVDVFSKLKQLETLFVEKNKIIFLPDKLFQNNQNLKWLNFSQNQLLVVVSLYPSETWRLQLSGLNFNKNPCKRKDHKYSNVMASLDILGKTLNHIYQKLNEESDKTMANTEDIQDLNRKVTLMESSKISSDIINELETFRETVTNLKYLIAIIIVAIIVVVLDVILAFFYLIKQLE